MNLLNLLVLFVTVSGSRGDESPDNYDSGELKQNQSILTEGGSSKPFSLTKDVQQENQGIATENEPDDLFSFHSQNENVVPIPSTEDEILARNLFQRFIKIHPNDYSNYDENFPNDEEIREQSPMRRQISNWRGPDNLPDPRNIPLNIDAYYPGFGSQFVQNEFSEDTGYLPDSSRKNDSYLELPTEYRDNSYQLEYPQYYQKNYYYNYYPMYKGRKYIPMKWNDEEKPDFEKGKGQNPRFFRKNSCRKYLEFLRYAFNELDQDTQGDYNEEYSDDWDGKEMQKNHPVFSTRLLGPTVYIDNSGKVSQIHSNGNRIQMLENISPTTKIYNPNDIINLRPTTPVSFVPYTTTETEIPTTFSNPEPDTTSTTKATGRPILRMDESEEETQPNTTEPPTLKPEIKNQNYFPFGQWRHTLDMFASRDRFSTTVSTDFMVGNRETSFHDRDNTEPTPQPENNFPPTPRFSPDDYYRRSDNTNENVTPPVIPEQTNSSVGPGLYWYVRSSTPTPTAIPSTMNHFKTKTVVAFGDAGEFNKKEDSDCNDKMLPCPDTVNITYPLNGYCNRYVSCESGRAIRRTCPEGLHFNLITKSCDFPHNSFCTYTCPEPDGYYGIPGDCSGYFICKNSMPEYRMCPPRMHWDINKSICTFAELSSCPMKCLKPNEVKPYEGDCKAYVICLNGIPYYHKCPPNMKFDSVSQSCIPESQSKCKNDARLLTKTSNPNSLCRDVEMKMGTKVWCSYVLSSDNQDLEK